VDKLQKKLNHKLIKLFKVLSIKMFYIRRTTYLKNKLYNFKSLYNFKEERNLVFNGPDHTFFQVESISYRDSDNNYIGSIEYHKQTGQIYSMYISNPKYIDRNVGTLMIHRVETLLKLHHPEVKELWTISTENSTNTFYYKVLKNRINLSPILTKYFMRL
jgi:hypothetical protein